MDFCEQKKYFSTQEVGRKMIFYNIYKTWIAWSIMITENNKVFVLNILEMKNVVFLSQKVDGNMIFTD